MDFLKFFCFVLLSVGFFTSCAQTKPVIKSITTYYYERLPGIIAVYPDGTPRDRVRDTILLTFAEVNGEAPQWKRAWKGGMFYSVKATMVTNTPVIIGRAKNDNKELSLQPSAGNTLWQLQLVSETPYHAPKRSIGKNEILLEGIFRGKTFYKKIAEQVEIASPQYQ